MGKLTAQKEGEMEALIPCKLWVYRIKVQTGLTLHSPLATSNRPLLLLSMFVCPPPSSHTCGEENEAHEGVDAHEGPHHPLALLERAPRLAAHPKDH